MAGAPIDEIKSRIDIVEYIRGFLELRPAGRNFKACCPFHKEKTPSFMISPDRQIWHCFGCGEGGDIFKFLMKYENLEFYEALKVLAEKAGIELARISPADQKEFDVLYELNREAADFYKRILTRAPAVREYLKDRGLLPETIDFFDIGFSTQNWDDLFLYLANKGFDSKDVIRAGLAIKTERGKIIDRFRGRIMFPLESSFGKVIGFSGRILPQLDKNDTAKYINSPETPIFNKSRLIFGLSRSKEGIREAGSALLVEGQMDVIMCHQDGVKNAVGTSGTALTDDQLTTLKRHTSKLIMNFDNDEAGKMAMDRSIDLAFAKDFEVRVLDFSKATDDVKALKDPADIVKNAPGEMKRLVDSAMPAMEYYFLRYPVGLNDITEKKNNIRSVIRKITNIPSAVERGHWLKELAFRSGLKESDIIEEARSIKAMPTTSGASTNSFVKTEKISKSELIANRICYLTVRIGNGRDILGEYKDYLPEQTKHLYNMAVFGNSPDNKEFDGLLTDMALKSGLNDGDETDENLEKEIEDLKKNLEIEYLSEKRDKLIFDIKSGRVQEKDSETILSEIQDISKKIDNIKKQ